MKAALIMEGGAMRGMFTSGIVDVFLENEIEFDGAAGISAGATFGCNYKSKQIGRSLRYNQKLSGDYRYGSFKSFIKTGDIYDAEYCYHDIPEKLDIFDTDTFENNPCEFWVGTTDVETGKPVYHKMTDGKRHDVEWIRASASIPVLSRIVELDGYKLLDGGVADSIPYEFMVKQGYEKSVIILTREPGYIKKKSKAMLPIKMCYRKYPKFIEAMATRHTRYNELVAKIEQDEKDGKVLILRPNEPLNIKQMEKNQAELERVYEIGRKMAEERLEEIREFLK